MVKYLNYDAAPESRLGGEHPPDPLPWTPTHLASRSRRQRLVHVSLDTDELHFELYLGSVFIFPKLISWSIENNIKNRPVAVST